ncbi:hypothetical protein INS49_000314 [Diaporthe citri]|uniref:uncharacterized protein n=1 Tax=Diaporthe citri TaxID=83186 RepID=UPI001C7E5EDE|nr:uncharacterized protein INS49_000314 [Diaporthe citri]KAG6366138.1 hypothetical protein INS49_000314 [Diaporthe citri]
MPPDQPDDQSRLSKRHRRARSVTMEYSSEVIDVSDSSEPGASSSRKHDRHEKDAQVEGPNKRHKQNRGSEPPMRKDTIMIPRAKRKKSRKEIDHLKASRTSNHQELKERVKELKETVEALECDLKSARRAHDDNNRENQENLKWHATELNILQARCSEQDDELRQQQQIVETERQENETLQRKLNDAANDVETLRLSCQNKDEELKGKEEVIAAKQEELDESKHRSASFEECLSDAELELKCKYKAIAALQKELDDSKRQSSSLEEFLAKMKLELKGKDEDITSLQKELNDNRSKSAALEQALGEEKRALKAAKRDQSDCRKELALTYEKLRSRVQELDQANTAREEVEKKNEALHVINDQNGHRNHNTLSREKKAKDALESLKTEHKDKASEFEAEKAELQTRCTELQGNLEAKKEEHNQMIANLQQKLKASRQQSQRYNYKEPDEKIKKDFANLESSIRQFVDKCARPVLNATDQELETAWPNWSLELRNFLASPLLCNLVLEAYVWECVVARIFTPGSNIWAGDLGRAMERALGIAASEIAQAGFESDLYSDLQYLRSSSSSLISRLNCADFRPKYFDSDVKAMTSTLAKLCGLDEIHDTMWADAMNIFKDAREFEIQLRLLKATYNVRMYKPVTGPRRLKYGFYFADEVMDNRSANWSRKSPEKAPLVDFIMCPALYKRGNNSGASYETKTCVIKMGVVCNATELCLKPGSSASAQSSSARAQKALFSGEAKQEIGGHASRNQPDSTANKAKEGSSMSNPFLVNPEETGPEQGVDPLSAPGVTYDSPAPKSRDAAPNMRTRSQAPPKTGSNAHDERPSTKSTSNHAHPTGAARGRGGGSSAKTTRQSKESDPEAEWIPKN